MHISSHTETRRVPAPRIAKDRTVFAEFRLAQALALLTFCISSPTFAAQPAKELLPPKTKVYVSVPDLDELQAKWGETQLGKLFKDPLMEPFLVDFARELDSTNAGINQRLRISLSELKLIAGGEVCFAIAETNDVPKSYAYILAIDTTGKEEQRREILKKINQDLVAKKAKWKVKHIQGVPLVSYDIPPQKAGDKRRELHLFSKDDQLVFSDLESAATVVIDRLANPGGDSLAKDKSFVLANEKCRAAGKETPQLSWYIEPFGFAYAMRYANGGKAPSPDLAKILHAEGFSAVKGIAGQFSFNALGNDSVYRIFVNAPATTQTPQKYERGARILNFPNSQNLTPPQWAPIRSASCLNFNWKMKESFQYVGSLVDAIAQLDGFFDQFLKDLMINSQGINLDVRNDFVAHFGERAVYLTDHLEPLNGDAEEQLFCIQLTNAEVVSNALDGVLNKDNTAEKKELDGQSYWTIDPNGEVNVADPKDPFFEDPFDDNPNGNANKPKKKRKRGLGSCVMVLRTDNNTGYLCFGVHEQQLIDVIKQRKNTATLVQQPNYVAVDKALKQLANNNLSFRSFVETDRAHRLNYELFRLGEFLEANTVLAKTLKQAFPTEKEKVLPNGRKIPAKNPNAQPLFNPNGQKLPPFEKVKQYFRPAGIAVESVDGGWLIHGAVLP